MLQFVRAQPDREPAPGWECRFYETYLGGVEPDDGEIVVQDQGRLVIVGGMIGSE